MKLLNSVRTFQERLQTPIILTQSDASMCRRRLKFSHLYLSMAPLLAEVTVFEYLFK